MMRPSTPRVSATTDTSRPATRSSKHIVNRGASPRVSTASSASTKLRETVAAQAALTAGSSSTGASQKKSSLTKSIAPAPLVASHSPVLSPESPQPSLSSSTTLGWYSSQVSGNPAIKVRSDFDKAALKFAISQHGLLDIVGGSICTGENNDRSTQAERPVSPADLDTPTVLSPNTAAQWTGLQLTGYTGPWNFFWASVQQIRLIFDPANGIRLKDDQIINHFPNHVELTRKDLMYKNIRRYVREASRAGGDSLTNALTGRRLVDCIPVTFSLPGDLSLFTEEYRKTPGSTWIVKPSNRSQGKGIFLINRFAQLQSWLREKNEEGDKDPYIASRYIARPLLIAGKKFDLRLYVLVTSFKPLVAYWHEEGFARFCATLYSEPKASVDITDEPLGAHLTNVAFQKGEEEYNTSHGGKWTLRNLWLFIEGAFGHREATGMLSDIHFLILHTLLSVQSSVHNDKHAFELYGYDILLDEELRPHLIEINASPSLRITTAADRALKGKVLLDTLRLVYPVVRHRNVETASPRPTSPSSPLKKSSSSGTANPPLGAAHPSRPPYYYTSPPSLSDIPFADYKRRPDLQAPHVGGFHLIDAGGK